MSSLQNYFFPSAPQQHLRPLQCVVVRMEDKHERGCGMRQTDYGTRWCFENPTPFIVTRGIGFLNMILS